MYMKYTINQLFEYARKSLPLDKFPEREEEITRSIIDIFNISRHEFNLNCNKILNEDQVLLFFDLIKQRQTGKPLAHILGYTYFYQDKFPVSEQTLIPRYDTEHLVETIRKFYIYNAPKNIIDIGTGTGAIALSLHRLFPSAKITGIDIVDEPFQHSKKSLNIDSGLVTVEKLDFLDHSNWNHLEMWDCIVSNPPYLDNHDMDVLNWHVKDFEPHHALYGGSDGMIFYENIALFAEKHLRDKGIIVLEIDHKFAHVLEFFTEEKYPNRKIINDFNNLERVLFLQKSVSDK